MVQLHNVNRYLTILPTIRPIHLDSVHSIHLIQHIRITQASGQAGKLVEKTVKHDS